MIDALPRCFTLTPCFSLLLWSELIVQKECNTHSYPLPCHTDTCSCCNKSCDQFIVVNRPFVAVGQTVIRTWWMSSACNHCIHTGWVLKLLLETLPLGFNEVHLKKTLLQSGTGSIRTQVDGHQDGWFCIQLHLRWFMSRLDRNFVKLTGEKEERKVPGLVGREVCILFAGLSDLGRTMCGGHRTVLASAGLKQGCHC